LPSVEGDKVRKQFKQYPIGYFHIGIAEVQTAQGKLYLFVAIDRTSKFAHVELHAQSDRTVAAAFLRSVIKAIPYKIHTILTDKWRPVLSSAPLPQRSDGPIYHSHVRPVLP
jgi:transposase-like protein